jgi:hypothetical protein
MLLAKLYPSAVVGAMKVKAAVAVVVAEVEEEDEVGVEVEEATIIEEELPQQQ